MQRLVFAALLLLGQIGSCLGSDNIFSLDETTVPIAARQEKAQLLLRLWGYHTGLLADQFTLQTEDGLKATQQALESLLSQADGLTTTAKLPWQTDHYLVWVLARAGMVSQLDFSRDSLRHFYQINPKQYPCTASASVSELHIPHAYLEAAGTTDVLERVAGRLRKEKFGRVSYEITGKLHGNPQTGLRGTVTPEQVGAERFAIYRETWNKPAYNYEAGRISGPHRTNDGYLFVEVYSLSTGRIGECFEFYEQDVAQDYGREWLKKIYADTLTTAMRELQPVINSFTSGTSVRKIAFSVAGHTLSFEEAHSLLPFLMGDGRDPRFWQSIQRQALEVELIYHGDIGQKVRSSSAYSRMTKAMLALISAKDNLDRQVADKVTTEAIRTFYDRNQQQYSEPTSLTYTLYTCGDTPECAALLENLNSSEKSTTEALEHVEWKSVRWKEQPREIQVAAQALTPGSWSEVFPYQGKPHRLNLHSIDRERLQFELAGKQIRERLEIEERRQFWRDFFHMRQGADQRK